MAEPFYAGDDATIHLLGLTFLQELEAIAGCCDSTPDGRMGLYAPNMRRAYQQGGDSYPLVAAKCISVGNSRVALHRRRMPYVKMEQTGRRILRRARALGIDLEGPEYVDEETSHGG